MSGKDGLLYWDWRGTSECDAYWFFLPWFILLYWLSFCISSSLFDLSLLSSLYMWFKMDRQRSLLIFSCMCERASPHCIVFGIKEESLSRFVLIRRLSSPSSSCLLISFFVCMFVSILPSSHTRHLKPSATDMSLA